MHLCLILKPFNHGLSENHCEKCLALYWPLCDFFGCKITFEKLFLATLGLCCCIQVFSSRSKRELHLAVVRGLLISVSSPGGAQAPAQPSVGAAPRAQ